MAVKPAYQPPPLPDNLLSRLRLKLRKTLPSQGIGPHLRRRQGQSLQFRDYRAYQFGDDIRAVDWMASARQSRKDQLIVRTFEAEERMTVVLILDNRPAMRLPEGAEKLKFALWAMECIATIAAEDGNDVVLAPLFGQGAPVRARGRGVGPVARKVALGLWSAAGAPDFAANPTTLTTALLPFLRPASAVVLLSDMLFDDTDGAVARLADLAQKQRRALMIVELDSMEHEIARLDRSRPARLSRFEGRDFPLAPVDLGEDLFQGARAAAQDLRRARRAQWAKSGLVWPAPVVWPTADFSLARFFTSSFPELAILRNLVTREGPG